MPIGTKKLNELFGPLVGQTLRWGSTESLVALAASIMGGVGGGLDADTLSELVRGYGRHMPARNRLPIKPMLIMSYDDGPIEDYTKAFPVHQDLGVPAEVCVNNFSLNTEGHLTTEHLLEMQESGWEVVSHGYNHLGLGIRSVSGLSEGSTTLRSANTPALTPAPYELLVFHQDPSPYAGEREETVTVVSTEIDSEGYLILHLDRPLQYSYTGHGAIRLSDRQLEIEIVQSQEELLEMGLEVTHFTYPFNASAPWSRRLVSRYYNSARSGGYLNPDPTSEDFFLQTFRLGSTGEVVRMSEAQIDAYLDDLAGRRGIDIIFEHTWGVYFSETKLRYLLEGALDRGIEVTTRSRMLERYGNLLEIGDVMGGPPAGEMWIKEQPYLVISKFGKVFSSGHSLPEIMEHIKTYFKD